MNNNNKLRYALAGSSLLIAPSAFAQLCQPVVWKDEFNQSSLDTSAWEIQIGDGCDQGSGMCGWGNDEQQSYQADNISLNNGILTIEARKQRTKSSQYTSGRIRTANMPNGGEWAFGRFEARLKFPQGQGMWPAFWMLPSNPSQGWPMSGEIDIFESVGQSANTAYGTIHYGQPWPDNAHQGGQIIMQPGKWSDDFHTYAIEWEPNEIRWYVDNMLYSTKTSADVAPEDWPFDGRNNFHFILNLAVGGTWGGTVDNSVLPQQMQVDFVRVFAGNQVNIAGNHLPQPGSSETYSAVNPTSGTSWSVTGGVISGSGSSIEVLWDASSAGTTQTLSVTSGGCTVETPIYVGKQLVQENVLENFDGQSTMTIDSSTGVRVVAGGVLQYTRDPNSQWDLISASTNIISDAGAFVVGNKAFEMDINNTDPSLVGRQILIQLEDSSVATPNNFPAGRHSKYEAFIANDAGWQTLRFRLVERMDLSTSDSSVNSIQFLFDPNSFNQDTYVIDNIVTLGAGSNVPPTASFNASCNNLTCNFDATQSQDPDGSIVSYLWNFGDGNQGTSTTANHSYATAGSYTVSLTVTDNDGATATSEQTVNVTSGEANATTVLVSNVSTTTQSAGKGKKFGVALVTIVDDLGNPVSGATVAGNFSGTWNESGSAVTDANGIAEIVTSSSMSGGVSVQFCVASVTTSLPIDEANSIGMCP